MIFAKTNKYGLDTKIYRMQQAFQEDLPWFNSVPDPDIEIYGKLYRNVDAEGRVIPEAYLTGTEYTQVFINDKIAATIGFLTSNDRAIENQINSANIDIVCSVNLDKIYGANSRHDEKALLQFIKVIRDDNIVMSINSVKEGVKNVFNGFYTENIKFNDMQPWYIFSVNVDVQYTSDLCYR